MNGKHINEHLILVESEQHPMKTSAIEKDISEFHGAMLEAQRDLDAFSHSIKSSLSGVVKEIDMLPALAQGLRQSNDTPAAGLINGEVDGWTSRLSECSRTTREAVTGHEFQNRFQKQPLVVVFGPVKAGKSTLGNFVLGSAFRGAPFDNPYRSGAIPKAPIVVEESGRKDARTKEWFDVNSIESTCSAQYFSVPGLVWVDTPGYGALEKKGIDIRPLADIARQYVGYADLVVFLDNSDAVWQREVSEAFKAVYTSGKKVLCAILRSDEPGEEDVVDGDIVAPLVAKDAAKRCEQEEYVRAGMRACGARPADCEVISVSVKLAEEAVSSDDAAKWDASGMGLFYRKIAAALGNGKVRDLKKEAPRVLLNGAVEKVCGMIGGLRTGLAAVQARLQEKYDALSPDGKLVSEIVSEAGDVLRCPIGHAVDDAIARAEAEGGEQVEVSMSELHAESVKAVNDVLSASVGRIVGDYRRTADIAFSTAAIKAGIVRGSESFEYPVDVPDWVPREPEGLWENICAFFGKSYHMAVPRREMRSQKIDLGFDGAQARRSLVEQFERAASCHVREELEAIRSDFFGKAMEKVEILQKRIAEVEKRVAICL